MSETFRTDLRLAFDNCNCFSSSNLPLSARMAQNGIANMESLLMSGYRNSFKRRRSSKRNNNENNCDEHLNANEKIGLSKVSEKCTDEDNECKWSRTWSTINFFMDDSCSNIGFGLREREKERDVLIALISSDWAVLIKNCSNHFLLNANSDFYFMRSIIQINKNFNYILHVFFNCCCCCYKMSILVV